MFAKGPQPGYSRKAVCLAVHPGAYCRRETSSIGSITGYVVYAADGTTLASAGNAQQAWREATSKEPRTA